MKEKIEKIIKKENQFRGKNIVINALIAFLPTTVIIALFETLGLPVGMPITGTIIFFSLIFLTGKIRTKEIKIGPTKKRNIIITILISVVAIFLIPAFVLHPVYIPFYTVNLAESLVSAGGGTFISTGVSLATGPIGGAIAFSGISGVAAYNMTSYQIMQEFLEIKNAEMWEKKGRNITLTEEEQLKDDFRRQVQKNALWKVIPEVTIILSLFR